MQLAPPSPGNPETCLPRTQQSLPRIRRWYSATLAQTLFLTLSTSLAGVACQPTTDVPTEQAQEYTLVGKVYDETGAPLAGARVSVDGVEATALTNAKGDYTVLSPFPFSETAQVAVSAQGQQSYYAEHAVFQDVSQTTSSRAGEQSGQKISVAQSGSNPVLRAENTILLTATGPTYLSVTAPLPYSTYLLDEDCEKDIEITGAASYAPRDNVRTDLMILLDRSGSSSKPFDPNLVGSPTIFEQEIEAAFKLLDALNPSVTRVSVMAFATSASAASPFTTDYGAVRAAIEAIRAEGPETIGTSGAATHYQAAMDAVRSAFDSSPLMAQDSNSLEETQVETLKALVFLSDGIPTLPVSPGTTQEKGDIQASLTAAQGLAASHIKAFTYAVGIPAATANLTTLHSIATITGGAYMTLDNPEDVTSTIPTESLVQMGMVRIENLATGAQVEVSTTPDGFFNARLPIVEDAQLIRVTALDSDNGAGISQELWVTGVQGIDTSEPQGLASENVAKRGVTTPTGGAPGDSDLYEYLISQEKDFPDAVESIATEVWGIFGTEGDVVLRGEYTYREACWNSDIGYLLVDPTDLEHSTQVAFAGATSTNLLFNTGTATTNCNQQYVATGTSGSSFQVTVPAGKAVVFFLVQNGKLSDGQKGAKGVIYTLSGLNPGGFDQVLSYYSEAGRRGNGSLPQSVLAWEDMTLSSGADQDYDDVIFYLEGIVPAARLTACGSGNTDTRHDRDR